MTRPLIEDDEGYEYISCPRCGHRDSYIQFDIFGACDNCIFCPICHCEFDADNGKEHKVGKCCEEVLLDPMSLKAQAYLDVLNGIRQKD